MCFLSTGHGILVASRGIVHFLTHKDTSTAEQDTGGSAPTADCATDDEIDLMVYPKTKANCRGESTEHHELNRVDNLITMSSPKNEYFVAYLLLACTLWLVFAKLRLRRYHGVKGFDERTQICSSQRRCVE